MKLPLSFGALFLSVALLQLSSGATAPLDALSGLALGFATEQIGLLGSAHFFGFFIGCWWAPRLMGTIGHSRAFAAFTATGAIGLMAHMIFPDPLVWAALRIMSGLCVAGCYTVIEAWLNAELTNATRGRTMGAYRVVDLGASLMAQVIIGVLEPATYAAYNLLAILCCAALFPLTLSKATQPATPAAPRLRPGLAWRRSPLAVAGVMVAGLTAAAFRMVGPVYGEAVGLRTDQIGLFLAAYVLGGALAQYPVGWLADRRDRRHVLIGLSVAAMAGCAVTVAAAGMGTGAVMVAATVFGMTTFPIYSVSSAHAFDFAEGDAQVEISAALMFFYAIGAILSPLIAAALLARVGPGALFSFIALGHLALVLFGLARMRARPSPAERVPYTYVPRTTYLVGRLLGFGRRRD